MLASDSTFSGSYSQISVKILPSEAFYSVVLVLLSRELFAQEIIERSGFKTLSLG